MAVKADDMDQVTRSTLLHRKSLEVTDALSCNFYDYVL